MLAGRFYPLRIDKLNRHKKFIDFLIIKDFIQLRKLTRPAIAKGADS